MDIHAVNSYLDRPSALLDEHREKVALVVLSAIISSIFVSVYNPLNINDIVIHSWLGFTLPVGLCGIIGASTLLLTQFVLRPAFGLRHMKIKQFIFWACLELFVISLVILFFYGETGQSLIQEYLITARLAVIITIIPYVLSCLLIAMIKKESSHVDQTEERDGNVHDFANLSDAKGKSKLIVKHKDLICLKAQDNYVQVTYMLNGRSEKTLIRTSMKAIALKLPKSQFLRIHRSHVINKDQIKNIVRQNNKLEVMMSYTDDIPIPVSSTYRDALDRQFSEQISLI